MSSASERGRSQLQKRARRHLLGSALIFFSLCVWIRVQNDSQLERPTVEIPEASATEQPAPSPLHSQGARYTLTFSPQPADARLPISRDAEPRLEALQASLDDCLWAWWARSPELKGPLSMELSLGREGLIQAVIVNTESLPSAVEACFKDALRAAPWPSLHPAQIWTHTQPFDPDALPDEDP